MRITQAMDAMRESRKAQKVAGAGRRATVPVPGRQLRGAPSRARSGAAEAEDRLDAERWLDEGGSSQGEGAAIVAMPASVATPARAPDYTCPECGHGLRVSGLGRHRVYFELDDERSDHSVIDRVCPRCGQSLPGKNPR